MKLLCIIYLIFLSSLNYSQWILVNNGLPLWDQAHCLSAIDSNNAIISTDKGLFRTLDGGKNWSIINLNMWVTDISSVGDNIYFAAVSNGSILYSGDGGETWLVQYDNPQICNSMNYIEMFDSVNGVAMGDAANSAPVVILKTTDAGSNWLSVNNSATGSYSGDVWRRIDFTDMQTGYFFISGHPSPVDLMKTIDGGANWLKTTLSRPVGTLKFFNQDYGLVHLKSPTIEIAVTTDGGNSFRFYDSPDGNISLQDIEFVPGDGSKIWHAGHKYLYFSSDSGATWALQSMTQNIECVDLEMTDSYSGWLLCRKGLIYRSTNAAQVISSFEEHTPLPSYFMLQNYPNPFNPSTTIMYSLATSGRVTLSIYDPLGREVVKLIDQEKPAGEYETKWNASSYPSGVYYLRMQAGEFTDTRKIILIK